MLLLKRLNARLKNHNVIKHRVILIRAIAYGQIHSWSTKWKKGRRVGIDSRMHKLVLQVSYSNANIHSRCRCRLIYFSFCFLQTIMSQFCEKKPKIRKLYLQMWWKRLWNKWYRTGSLKEVWPKALKCPGEHLRSRLKVKNLWNSKAQSIGKATLHKNKTTVDTSLKMPTLLIIS